MPEFLSAIPYSITEYGKVVFMNTAARCVKRPTVYMDRDVYFTGENAAIGIAIQNPTPVPIRIFDP